MNYLKLAKKGKRMLARLIDFLIVTILGLLLYFTVVYPNYFKKTNYDTNRKTIIDLYEASELYVVTSEGDYAGKSTFTYSNLEDTLDKTLTYKNKKIEHDNLWKDLFIFYTAKKENYSGSNISANDFKANILKVGSDESNIAKFDETTFTYELKDSSRQATSLKFFLQIFEDASVMVNKSEAISTPTNDNRAILFSTVAMVIPCLVGFSLIFDLIIPLCMPHGETIGKKIFNLGVVSKTGYKLNKWLLVPRFLVYIGFEYILGIMTFGGCFLISYTMFLFVKNRRCMHDLLSASVVIDMKESLFFDTPIEKAQYEKFKGN